MATVANPAPSAATASAATLGEGVLWRRCDREGCLRNFRTNKPARRYCSHRCRSAAWDAEHPRARPIPAKPLARRGRQGLPGHVRLTLGLGGRWLTSVAGISTDILAARMRAGESIEALCDDYMITREWVEDAIRWELIPRRSRVRLVDALVKAGAR